MFDDCRLLSKIINNLLKNYYFSYPIFHKFVNLLRLILTRWGIPSPIKTVFFPEDSKLKTIYLYLWAVIVDGANPLSTNFYQQTTGNKTFIWRKISNKQ